MQEVDLMLAGFADNSGMAQSLAWIAERLGWAGRYGEARDVFEILVRDYPASTYAQQGQLWSAKMNCCALINAGKDEDALAAIDKLIKDFAFDERLAEAVYWIGKEYEWKRGTVEDRTTRYGTPESVYGRLVQEFGDTTFGRDAAWDKKRLEHRTRIFTLMKDGEPNEVSAAIADMEADLAGRAELVSELYWVGREYEEYPDKYPLARQKYEQIIGEYPESVEASQAQLDIARLEILSLIMASDINKAEVAIDKFVEAFNGNPHAGPCLRRIATEYYLTATELAGEGRSQESADYYRRAVGVWGRVIERTEPTLEDTGAAYYFIGVSYRWLGEQAEAVEYFQTVLDDWLDFEYAWSAQYLVGSCYEKLKSSGVVESERADEIIEDAYEAVLARYADSPAGDNACLKLAQMGLDRGEETIAIEYLKLFLELAEPDDSRIDSVKAQLEQLEKGGE